VYALLGFSASRAELTCIANVLNIMIMRKETFAIHLETEMARDQLMKDMLDCIEYAASSE
jgi:hypothetical protein